MGVLAQITINEPRPREFFGFESFENRMKDIKQCYILSGFTNLGVIFISYIFYNFALFWSEYAEGLPRNTIFKFALCSIIVIVYCFTV